MREMLQKKKRIVIKVGSSALVDAQGRLDPARCRSLAKQVATLVEQKRQVILVSSGAIAAGLTRMGLDRMPRHIPEKQALAATGQTALMHQYEKAFAKYKLHVAQILLTLDDLSDRRRFLNARHTFHELFKWKIIPIVNENDTVAVHEIKVGDNDNLSALVTNVVEADLLINLSDVDGVFEQDPRVNPQAKRIGVIEQMDAWLKRSASDTLRIGSTGGMMTKLEAAEKAQCYGVATVIANGKKNKILEKILMGKDVGTLILPKGASDRLSARKHWLAYSMKAQGVLVVDEGAKQALRQGGKSLLPSGIRLIEGRFQQGDPIDIKTTEGKVFARGLTGYSSQELERIKGQKTTEIEKILGYKYFDEVIHRDDLVLLPD
jgi:glutamate 5-kinase